MYHGSGPGFLPIYMWNRLGLPGALPQKIPCHILGTRWPWNAGIVTTRDYQLNFKFSNTRRDGLDIWLARPRDAPSSTLTEVFGRWRC